MSATAFQRMRREAELKKQAESKKPDLSKLKYAEIKVMLDQKGIGYDAKAKKKKLIKLLEGAE